MSKNLEIQGSLSIVILFLRAYAIWGKQRSMLITTIIVAVVSNSRVQRLVTN